MAAAADGHGPPGPGLDVPAGSVAEWELPAADHLRPAAHLVVDPSAEPDVAAADNATDDNATDDNATDDGPAHHDPFVGAIDDGTE